MEKEKPRQSLRESLKELFSTEDQTLLPTQKEHKGFLSKTENQASRAKTNRYTAETRLHKSKPNFSKPQSVKAGKRISSNDKPMDLSKNLSERNPVCEDMDVDGHDVTIRGNNPIKKQEKEENELSVCPLCQQGFPAGATQIDKDGHIAQCLSMTTDDVW